MNKTIRRARTTDVAFTYRMPSGIPGSINRATEATVEAAQLDATNYPTAYGVPGVIDATSKNFRKVMAADTTVYGLYVRPYPTTGGSGTDPLGTSTPPTSGIGNVLKRGYLNVKVYYGYASVAKNSAVYVRTVSSSNNTNVGTFDATADSSNNFVLTNAYFTGACDSNGNCEIAYNL
jgi:hypothetical protein